MLAQVVETGHGSPQEARVNVTFGQGRKDFVRVFERAEGKVIALGQQNVRIGLVLDRQTLALEVVQAIELETGRAHQRVAHVQKGSGFLQAAGPVICVGGQRKDRITVFGRVAQCTPLVEGEPPRVLNGRGIQAFCHQFGQVDIKPALWPFGLAEGQVVRVGANAQRLGSHSAGCTRYDSQGTKR